jgi:hypothetical protein
MRLAEAIAVARRVLAEHGGIEMETRDMRPHAVPINPDNAEQVENAVAYNAMHAFTSMLAFNSLDAA